jgi:hypothetical protein
MKLSQILGIIFLLLFSLKTEESYCQYIYQYNNNTTGAYATLAANATCAATLTRVNGALTGSACSQGFSSIGFTGAGTYASTLPAIETFVAPNNGYQLNITQIRVDCSRAAANGASTCMLAYSTDGVTWTAEGTAQTIVTNACTAGLTQNTWNISITASSTIYIRAYLYAAGSSAAISYLKNFWITGSVSQIIVPGCTNPNSCNYCSNCTIDDGSCIPAGCMNTEACNYNPVAQCDNGGCIFVGSSCNDNNPETTGDQWIDCETCIGLFASPISGVSIQEVPIDNSLVDQIEDQLPVSGNGSLKCFRVFVCFEEGNTDWEIINMFGDVLSPFSIESSTSFYQNPIAGSPLASEIEPSLFNIYPELEYDSWFTIGNLLGESNDIELLQSSNLPFSVWESTGTNFLENSIEGSSITGLLFSTNQGQPTSPENSVLIGQFTTDGILSGTLNLQLKKLNSDGTPFIETQLSFNSESSYPICNPILGCINANACNYVPSANVDDGSCLFFGCTDPLACNFDSNASCENGTCVFPGCTDPQALNYNPAAGCDDETCQFPECPGDLNTDGTVNISDFLMFIGQFASCVGVDCSADLNNDSQVTIQDFLIFSSVFGNTCY